MSTRISKKRPNSSKKKVVPGRKKKSNPSKKNKKSFSFFKFFIKLSILAIVIGSIPFSFYIYSLNKTVKEQFEGNKWVIPSHIYSKPIELRAGISLSESKLKQQLNKLGYSETSDNRSGNYASYTQSGEKLVKVFLRTLESPSIKQASKIINIQIKNSRISAIYDDNFKQLNKVYLEPQLIGTIGKNREEDRKLIKLADVPKPFIATLLLTEDRDFMNHHGVSIKGITRAMISNIKSGRFVQGGSTITQQLVKNFFLTSERKLRRKIKEALIALLLEHNYSKQEILEAYINEVNLGQAGNRAIHGFNLASYFYFNRPLNELTLDQYATLVGMVKGPSLYNPIRNPKNAINRRNVVIGLMKGQQLINESQYDTLINQPLKVSNSSSLRSNQPFPAYIDYLLDDLSGIYSADRDDIQSNLQGVDIYTTMDIRVQLAAEEALTSTLATIEASKNIKPNSLQGSVIVAEINSGNILAIVSDRNPRFSGFNRAIDAKRSIGSLLKPIIYLSALQQPGYTLASIIDDAPLTVKLDNKQNWQPNNYDKKFSGNILLVDALAKSKNIPAVKTGLDIGVLNVIETANKMGLDSKIPPYPSILLGSSEHSALELTQMYQTLANGGRRINLHSVSHIYQSDNQDEWINSVPKSQMINEDISYLINNALEKTSTTGTARSLRKNFKASQIIAGKTGTTNNYKDSWFVGYSGNLLTLVWVGRDDNRSSTLTGASGALKVWDKLYQTLGTSSWPQPRPSNIHYHSIQKKSGMIVNASCQNAQSLPFIIGTEPPFGNCFTNEENEFQRKKRLQEALINEENKKQNKSGSWLDRLF